MPSPTQLPKRMVSAGLHYATVAALIVSNICLLLLAGLFAAMYGQGVGGTAATIEQSETSRSAQQRAYEQQVLNQHMRSLDGVVNSGE